MCEGAVVYFPSFELIKHLNPNYQIVQMLVFVESLRLGLAGVDGQGRLNSWGNKISP